MYRFPFEGISIMFLRCTGNVFGGTYVPGNSLRPATCTGSLPRVFQYMYRNLGI